MALKTTRTDAIPQNKPCAVPVGIVHNKKVVSLCLLRFGTYFNPLLSPLLPPLTPEACYISDVYTAPSCRRQGFCTLLYQSIFAYLKAQGVLEARICVDTYNRANRHLVAKAGFTAQGILCAWKIGNGLLKTKKKNNDSCH